jgi:hypothetical protein
MSTSEYDGASALGLKGVLGLGSYITAECQLRSTLSLDQRNKMSAKHRFSSRRSACSERHLDPQNLDLIGTDSELSFRKFMGGYGKLEKNRLLSYHLNSKQFR